MKILLSPAKTMNLTTHPTCQEVPLAFPKKTKELKQELTTLSKKTLGTRLNIKGNLLETTYDYYHNNAETGHAFYSYDGLVFKQLHIPSYKQEEHVYINEHVRILDALYGVLHPCNMVEYYRLDMKYKRRPSLYQYWDVSSYFKKDEMLINLASNEYAKMIHHSMITVDFKEKRDNGYKTVATYAKQARGMMLHYMITNQIKTIDDMKQFNKDNYQYNASLSDDFTLVFTR